MPIFRIADEHYERVLELAGTQFLVEEVERDADGATAHYKITPPGLGARLVRAGVPYERIGPAPRWEAGHDED